MEAGEHIFTIAGSNLVVELYDRETARWEVLPDDMSDVINTNAYSQFGFHDSSFLIGYL